MVKISCEIIKDLLPLYSDGVCSPESRQAVDEHLSGCPECRAIYKQLNRNEIDRALSVETETVVAKQKKLFRRKSFIVGTVFSGIFMIPILTCMIVNLAVGAALDWFFIVLTALMLTASVVVVPLMVPGHRFLYTLASSLTSPVLLLLCCSIYTGGGWFFVASSSVLFGVSVVFLPVAVRCEPLRRILAGYKALTVFAVDTLLFALMMLCIGCYVKYDGFARLSIAVSLPILVFAWAMMLIIRYLPAGRMVRAGVCAVLSGIMLFFSDQAVGAILGELLPMPEFSPLIWNYATIDGNVKWLCLLCGIITGVIFILIGMCRKGKKQ